MEKTFLGTGWGFPVRFDNQHGMPALSSDEQDIRESLFILLSTLPGERLMYPDYGCDLNSQVFEEIDRTTLANLSDLISTAITNYEPRIDLDTIDFDASKSNEGMLNVHISYMVRAVNVRNNIVYPFYLLEGTNVQL